MSKRLIWYCNLIRFFLCTWNISTFFYNSCTLYCHQNNSRFFSNLEEIIIILVCLEFQQTLLGSQSTTWILKCILFYCWQIVFFSVSKFWKILLPALRLYGWVKGRLQNPTAGWPAVPSGSGRLSLFRTIETGRNRTEPPVNRRLGFEAVPNLFEKQIILLFDIDIWNSFHIVSCILHFANELFVLL